MNREEILTRLENQNEIWDILIIGGGATGLGCAVDAASRGYKTLLVEQHDFAKATSSRSTKLVHGGVRYLRQGNVSLVLEALKERGFLLRNAPHLVTNQSFIVPGYKWWEKIYYGIGLTIYDLLAGKRSFGRSKFLSTQKTLAQIPTLETSNLKGGILYHDGQFDDARLAINLMQTVFDHGGTALNYARVVSLEKKDTKISGVTIQEGESGNRITLKSKVVINATGIFTDEIRKLNDPDTESIIQVSQGIHLVLDREFYPGKSAMMIPKTKDGRVLFAVPWHNKVIIGTTDTPMNEALLEPRAEAEEIRYLLEHIKKYLAKDPDVSDVKSVFAGLRPLVNRDHKKKTKSISRDHSIICDPSELITITGGKWTTYRKMGEETIDLAIKTANLEPKKSVTSDLNIHGWTDQVHAGNPYPMYGSDASQLKKLSESIPDSDKKLHPNIDCTKIHVIWAVRNEMARSIEDVLSRRTRSLLLDARASAEAAPLVAEIMAWEMNRDRIWQDKEIETFRNLAKNYLPKTSQ